MPQSLARVLVHLVFSTKHREPLLNPSVRYDLHAYLGSVLNSNGCVPLRVGGVEDHVHLFFALSRTMTIAQVVESVKTSSCKWLKTKDAALAGFRWQGGYGIFSVSESDAVTVVDYITNQEDHHADESFQDEFRRLHKEGGSPYDERFVWD